MSAVQRSRGDSGMGETGKVADEREELTPFAALRGEELAAARCDAVVAAAALIRFLHPASLNQGALFELVEGGVERREVEGERAARSLVNQLDELVAVARLVLEEREDDQFGGPLLGFPDGAAGRHIGEQHISDCRILSNATCLTLCRRRSADAMSSVVVGVPRRARLRRNGFDAGAERPQRRAGDARRRAMAGDLRWNGRIAPAVDDAEGDRRRDVAGVQ